MTYYFLFPWSPCRLTVPILPYQIPYDLLIAKNPTLGEVSHAAIKSGLTGLPDAFAEYREPLNQMFVQEFILFFEPITNRLVAAPGLRRETAYLTAQMRLMSESATYYTFTSLTLVSKKAALPPMGSVRPTLPIDESTCITGLGQSPLALLMSGLILLPSISITPLAP